MSWRRLTCTSASLKSWETWKFWRSYNKWSWRSWIFYSLAAAQLPTLGVLLLASIVPWCGHARTTFVEEMRTAVRRFKIFLSLFILVTSLWSRREMHTVLCGLQYCVKHSMFSGGPSLRYLRRVLVAIVGLAVIVLFASVPIFFYFLGLLEVHSRSSQRSVFC
ncbi:uncharacterized protein LOC117650899 [Thrips palmi]|uniref:Uncharacterized protein LOC117650899 n=1 Tax=Thrips palmi TaxID=161013 RepID=A0A6P8ZYC9_THRPL|nr:uncharacterized protein LOC117650899 [Thrips palmi]